MLASVSVSQSASISADPLLHLATIQPALSVGLIRPLGIARLYDLGLSQSSLGWSSVGSDLNSRVARVYNQSIEDGGTVIDLTGSIPVVTLSSDTSEAQVRLRYLADQFNFDFSVKNTRQKDRSVLVEQLNACWNALPENLQTRRLVTLDTESLSPALVTDLRVHGLVAPLLVNSASEVERHLFQSRLIESHLEQLGLIPHSSSTTAGQPLIEAAIASRASAYLKSNLPR